mgnify:CR=1 FL=1
MSYLAKQRMILVIGMIATAITITAVGRFMESNLHPSQQLD